MKSLIILCLFLVFPVGVYAGETDIITEQLEASGVYEIETGTSGIAPEFDFGTEAAEIAAGGGSGFAEILKNVVNMLFAELKNNISASAKIILIALCLGVLSNFAPEEEQIMNTAFYVSYSVIFIMIIGSFTNAVTVVEDAINSMNIFVRAAVPVLGGLVAASGGAAKAGVVSWGVIGASSAMSALSGIVLPAAVFAAMLGGVNNLSGRFSLGKLSAAIKKAVMWSLGIVMTVFAAVLATKGFAAVNLDATFKRTIKYAASNFVPIVGGVLSETLESVLACTKLVKTAAGSAGIIAVLYICLAPVIKLVSVLVIYKITSLVITPVCDRRISGVVDEMSSALTIIIALVLASGLMFIVCTGMIAAM